MVCVSFWINSVKFFCLINSLISLILLHHIFINILIVFVTHPVMFPWYFTYSYIHSSAFITQCMLNSVPDKRIQKMKTWLQFSNIIFVREDKQQRKSITTSCSKYSFRNWTVCCEIKTVHLIIFASEKRHREKDARKYFLKKLITRACMKVLEFAKEKWVQI